MTIEIVIPEGSQKTYEAMHFAPAVKHNGLIMCSGVIGMVDGKVPEKPKTNFGPRGKGSNIPLKLQVLS